MSLLGDCPDTWLGDSLDWLGGESAGESAGECLAGDWLTDIPPEDWLAKDWLADCSDRQVITRPPARGFPAGGSGLALKIWPVLSQCPPEPSSTQPTSTDSPPAQPFSPSVSEPQPTSTDPPPAQPFSPSVSEPRPKPPQQSPRKPAKRARRCCFPDAPADSERFPVLGWPVITTGDKWLPGPRALRMTLGNFGAM